MAEYERVEMINGLPADQWRKRFNDDGSPKKGRAEKATDAQAADPNVTAPKGGKKLTAKETKAAREKADKEAAKHTPAPANAGLPESANVENKANLSTPGVTTDSNVL